MRLHRIFYACACLATLLGAGGCSTVGYYSQAVGGHLELMRAREPVSELLENPDTDPELKNKLQTLIDARQFAVDHLDLPDNDSYKTYAATGRRYVTWNVVAAEEFSLRAKTWCFPVAGCVSYRGYFAEEDANDYAAGLKTENYDVVVGGASAYSTLGWFEDPVLDTMLSRGDIGYVSTLFHELAHQVLYVQDDSNFNEAFATFVEQEGVRIWLEHHNETDRIAGYNRYLGRIDDFTELLKSTRQQLVALYKESNSVELMREQKQAVFANMRSQYETIKQTKWNGYNGYDGWFARELNNARLISVATYRRYVPAFAQLYKEAGSDLPAFYALSKSIADLPAKERRERMDSYLAQ